MQVTQLGGCDVSQGVGMKWTLGQAVKGERYACVRMNIVCVDVHVWCMYMCMYNTHAHTYSTHAITVCTVYVL